ncbi:MAG: ATP-binding protein, partial [Candidatus Margulisbacteria bacterium]|nr:ATP-binding protein [Candidatus Margulisiibacteriota bacterium]
LGLLVFFNDPKHESNRSFSLMTLSLAFWALSIYLLGTSQHVVFWGRIVFLGPVIIPVAFLYFSWAFPRKRFEIKWFQHVLLAIPTLAMLLIVPTDLITRKVAVIGGRVQPVSGPGYQYFVLYFLIYISCGLIELIIKYRSSTGVQKIQLGYVFLGCFLTVISAATPNLILPLFGLFQFTAFGPFFLLFLVGFVAYAIVKHRLMSIEVVIQRSTVYGTATVLIMALYALAVIASETVFRRLMGYSSLLITAAAALLIAVVYQPLVRGFQNVTDRLFFRGRYDYQKTLREISQQIASVIKLEELTRLIVASFIDTMKVSEISFLLMDREREHFRSVALSLPRYKKIEIDVGSPIIAWLSRTKDILVRDEIESAEVRDEMERLGISIWVPIISKEELIGIIALGDKLSGDVFTAEDIGLLVTLANQTAVALDNARLYDEVVNMKDYSEKILESMVSGVLTVDGKGRVVTYNLMAEKITGRKTAEVLGKNCEEIWGKRGMVANIVENTLNKGKCYVNFDSSLASPERGLVPVSFSSTVLYDHHGKKIGALVTLQDLSEVKELEEKVRRADKLAALATMAAGMAHEIKNPLSSMKVLSQLLPKKIDDPEFKAKISEIIPREINRIDRIVESLLSFARATALNFERTNLNELIEETLKYFEDQARAAEVKIVRNFGALPEIEVDRSQISQVFSNLILNAIQAMSGGGELKVATVPGKRLEDEVRQIKVQVSDTGHGIPEDTIKKLFDPFFTTKYGGTGLGLTITHSIVDGHKGYIDVDSEIGKGTTFTVTLPVSQGLV